MEIGSFDLLYLPAHGALSGTYEPLFDAARVKQVKALQLNDQLRRSHIVQADRALFSIKIYLLRKYLIDLGLCESFLYLRTALSKYIKLNISP